MNNEIIDEAKLYEYEDDAELCDDDFDDFDDFDDDIDDDETNSFENVMKAHSTDVGKLRIAYNKFSEWYNGMLSEINCPGTQKALVCSSLIRYINSSGPNDDTAKLWAVCIADHSDMVFEGDEDSKNDEEYLLYNYMLLSDEVESVMLRLKKEKYYTRSFLELANNITFADKPCVDFDLADFYESFNANSDPDEPIRDNIKFAAEKIIRSPELSKIMPVAFTALFTRYQKKMYSSQGYEPNFTKLLRRMEYGIDRDNGKNIESFCRQLNMYKSFRHYFDCCDKNLCDAGFAAISNITACEMIMWEDYPELTLPVCDEYRYRYFDCFPNGYLDNPYFTGQNVSYRKLDKFEYKDNLMPARCRIIENAEKYIRSDASVSERYMELIRRNETSKCTKLINDVIENSEIQTDRITTENAIYAYTSIVGCIMNDLSERIKRDMLDAAKTIEEYYFNTLT